MLLRSIPRVHVPTADLERMSDKYSLDPLLRRGYSVGGPARQDIWHCGGHVSRGFDRLSACCVKTLTLLSSLQGTGLPQLDQSQDYGRLLASISAATIATAAMKFVRMAEAASERLLRKTSSYNLSCGCPSNTHTHTHSHTHAHYTQLRFVRGQLVLGALTKL